MPSISTTDHSVTPPLVTIEDHYNAAYDLLQRNLQNGRAENIAIIDDQGSYTYQELDQRSSAVANVLRDMGLQTEQRVLVCLHDTIDFPSCFLGAIKAGIVPVAVNTLLTADDYEYMLENSRARVAIVSAPLYPLFEPLLEKLPSLERILISGGDEDHVDDLASLRVAAPTQTDIADTKADGMCFWLYSSGSTGSPKGTVHVHSSLIQSAELYAKPILGIDENDVVFSAAKLFFAYGLGNGLTFPMSVGATAVLMAERPTPEAVFERLIKHQPSIFYGVPTLYAAMLASRELPQKEQLNLRCCTSAGEPLPEDIGKRWLKHFSVDILDGIGSTEMLHIFLSNAPGGVKYGTTGVAVPGYKLSIVDDDGHEVAQGESGELRISGPTAAVCYWNELKKSRGTFVGEWVRSGDKYSQDENGYYVYAGRSDDMLKVSGIYVSPIEVESSLITHEAVLEAAVVGHEDENNLIKPAAYVVLNEGVNPGEDLKLELKEHVKSLLAPYKYPRWFHFVEDLPKTATGKIQRFKLRNLQ
ncbi:MAG: benzoate-CoA ligase family protein [Proteobacteria bacterium]|nr:benzoate-CoA ligase family protein [Pseudomonadota bacterium]